MRTRAPRLRLTAMAGLAAFALLGIAPDRRARGAAAREPGDPQRHVVARASARGRRVRRDDSYDAGHHRARSLRVEVPVAGAESFGDGVFYASARVPWFARFYHGTFHVTFVGTDATGDQAQMEADVRI